MTFDTEKAKLSREPFFIVKLELDTTITDTGTEYHCNGRAPLGQKFYSSIVDGGVDTAPTRMGVGSGLGFLGGVNITFNDFPFGANGTYFGKLLANNPYYLDRKIKVYTGFYDGVTFDWSNFKEKLYFIKKIKGPDSNGRVVISAHDPLTQLNADESSIPTTPNAKLASSITSSQTGTINITDNTDFDAGGGTADFDGEFVSYSGVSGSDSIVVTARGAFGTTADSHDSGDQVSNCYAFSDTNVVDLIRTLIETFTPIDHANYINDTDWNTQRDDFLFGRNATGVYIAGTPIKDEIEKLCEQFRISVFWNDEDQEIKLVSISPLVEAAKRVNINEHILDEEEDVIRDQTKIITRTIVYYGRIDHSKDEDDKNNYSQWLIDPNDAAETGLGKEKVKEIYAKNIPTSGVASANNLADKVNKQYSQGLTTHLCLLDISSADIAIGEVFEVFSDKVPGTDGLPIPTSFIAVERDYVSGTIYKYRSIRTGFALGSKYRRIAPNSLAGTTYTSASEADKARYLCICANNGQFSNGDSGHQIY